MNGKLLNILLIFFVLVLLTSYTNMYFMSIKIQAAKLKNDQFQKEVKIYLNSLVNNSINHNDVEIRLITGDTLNSGSYGLYFYFTPTECKSCVEEIIFFLKYFVKFSSIEPVYILSTTDKKQYLSFLSEINKFNPEIHFGHLLNNLSQTCFWMINKNGCLSNVFYPVRGEFLSTQKYLETLKESFQKHKDEVSIIK
jgi:hypothetical protein